MHLSRLQMILFRRMENLRPGDGKRYTVPKEVRACQLDWPGPEFGAFPN
jgi:hypothetical protein